MSEMIERVARSMAALITEPGMHPDAQMARCMVLARAAIEAMRPEFKKLSEAYSPQSDDTVWIDDRTPIGQYVDSIINRVDATE